MEIAECRKFLRGLCTALALKLMDLRFKYSHCDDSW